VTQVVATAVPVSQDVMVYGVVERGWQAPSNVATGTSLPNYTASRP